MFLEDFAPGINSFWRSRPVNLKLWFVVKYLVGLSVLVLAFGSLLTPAYWLQTEIYSDQFHRFLYAAFFAIYCLVIMYILSMATYCLLRQPIYAVVLTIGLLFIGTMAINWLSELNYFASTWIAMIFCLVIPITIAWLVVKHDWGWKVGR